MAAKNDELIVGATYRVRLTSGKWVNASFKSTYATGGYKSTFSPACDRRSMKRYVFTSLETGREITIKSRQRIKEGCGTHTPSVPPSFNTER